MVTLLYIILSGFFVGIQCGFWKPTSSSPKLTFSLSPLYMCRLSSREIDIYKDLKNYSASNFKNLPLLHEYLEDYENSTMKRGHRTVEEHLLLVYRMIARFVHYVTPLLKHFNESAGKIEQQLFEKLEERQDVFYPNEKQHLLETATNILHVFHVADLKAADVIRGRFMDIETGISLKPQQILEFAEFASKLELHSIGIDFLSQPELNYEENATIFRDEIKNQIISDHDNTFDERIEQGDLYIFQKPLSQGHSLPLKTAEYKEWLEYGQDSEAQRELQMKVLALCSHQRRPKLHTFTCWNDHTHPYFTIGPVKTEKISASPEMFLFHDIIGDKAINVIETAVAPQIEEALFSPDGDPVTYSWLPNTDLKIPLIPKLEKILRLSMLGDASEDVRHTLFHVGGNGDQHYDAFQAPNFLERFNDRLSTYLLYFKDIELGGETVFPYIDVVVKPQKGTLLFWHNYDKTGKHEWRSLHGICPPILGIKTYISSWIRKQSNIFTRHCGLSISNQY